MSLQESSSNIAEGNLSEEGHSSPANWLFAVSRHKAICRSGSSGNGEKKVDNGITSKGRNGWIWKQLWVIKGKSKIDFRALNSGDWENYY